MVTTIDRITRVEKELIHERFADFERGVLQDNIVLCDIKSGALLAFASAMVIFCIDAFVGGRGVGWTLHSLTNLLFLLAAAAFLFACHFSLTTVLPRLHRERGDDHIFWEAPIFDLSLDDYVDAMDRLERSVERRDKLSHLHMLAGICRSKYRHFQRAIRTAQAGFILLVVAELARIAT